MDIWCRIRKYLKHLLTGIPKDMNDTGPAFLNDLLPWSENPPDQTIYLDFFQLFSHLRIGSYEVRPLYSCFLAAVVL